MGPKGLEPLILTVFKPTFVKVMLEMKRLLHFGTENAMSLPGFEPGILTV